MNSAPKILFIGLSPSSDDRKAWSGTVYQAFQGLIRAGFQVDYLSAMRDLKETFTDKLLCKYWLTIPGIFGKKTRMDEAFYMVRLCRQTLAKFDYTNYDIIFVPTFLSVINALPKNIKPKIVHLVDATVDSLFDYYDEFSNLWFHNYWEAHYLGKKAFRRSDMLIASSDWCKLNAINQYGISSDKITVVEFGANIDAKDIPMISREYLNNRPLNIYWSGVNWKRKGGEIAFACCKELIDRGYDIRFHITGMKSLPKEITDMPWVVNHGFLNKNNPDEYQHLINIMINQDLFLFPSRAECSSIALCEANAFALPCFAYQTGGTANYIENGQNGYMISLERSFKDFADIIEKCVKDGSLQRLSIGSREKYETCLNWNIWSRKLHTILTKIL